MEKLSDFMRPQKKMWRMKWRRKKKCCLRLLFAVDWMKRNQFMSIDRIPIKFPFFFLFQHFACKARNIMFSISIHRIRTVKRLCLTIIIYQSFFSGSLLFNQYNVCVCRETEWVTRILMRICLCGWNKADDCFSFYLFLFFFTSSFTMMTFRIDVLSIKLLKVSELWCYFYSHFVWWLYNRYASYCSTYIEISMLKYLIHSYCDRMKQAKVKESPER